MPASETTRGTADRATDGTATTNVGNPGVLIGTQDVGGQPYARYRATKGTWVSSSLQEQGYARLYGRNTGYGAYTGLVRSSDGTALTNPDRIRPGQEFLVPVLPAAQPVPGRTEASPWTTGLFANVEASRGNENRYGGSQPVTALTNPDRIRPGQEFLVPVLPAAQPVPNRTEASPWTTALFADIEASRGTENRCGGSQPVTTALLAEGAAALVNEIEAIPYTDIARQWKAKRGKFLMVANHLKNNLSGHQLFQIWLQFWIEQEHKALADEKAARMKVWSRDNVAYADNMFRFRGGRRDALGPEYQEAADRLDAASFLLSGQVPTQLLNWLEARVDIMHEHLTLGQVEYKALELAQTQVWFQTWIEPVLLGMLGWAQSAPRSPSRAPTRDPEPIGKKNVPAPVPEPPTVRPFLTAERIREMLARGVRVLTFRSFNSDVVQNQQIKPTGETNPNFGDKVAFVEGFQGANYGPYRMVIEMDKVGRLYPHPVSPGEYYTPDPIPAGEGYWTTSEEVAKAFRTR
jgi:hypothetical protein